MNVAEHFSRLDSATTASGIATANRILPPIVCAVLVMIIAYKFADITWSLFPGEDYARPGPLVSAGSSGGGSSQGTANLDHLRDTHLFGEAPAEPLVEAAPIIDTVDAPDTTLNLTLSGVVVRELNDDSEAIIGTGRSNQPDQVYRVGDSIEGGNGADLYHVYADRVVLNRSGRLETLRLPQDENANTNVQRTVTRPTPQPAAAPTPLRQVISQNATALTRVMRFAPHVEAGEIIGFRVSPGAESETFETLGFQAGDVVTEINGIAMNDPSRGIEAFEALGESTMANIVVLRNGTPDLIVVDTTKISGLTDGRQ